MKGPIFDVKGGAHPVVESVQPQGVTFVNNDCSMNQHRMWIVTGPNMGGEIYVHI